jgi:hypothetical protein
MGCDDAAIGVEQLHLLEQAVGLIGDAAEVELDRAGLRLARVELAPIAISLENTVAPTERPIRRTAFTVTGLLVPLSIVTSSGTSPSMAIGFEPDEFETSSPSIFTTNVTLSAAEATGTRVTPAIRTTSSAATVATIGREIERIGQPFFEAASGWANAITARMARNRTPIPNEPAGMELVVSTTSKFVSVEPPQSACNTDRPMSSTGRLTFASNVP